MNINSRRTRHRAIGKLCSERKACIMDENGWQRTSGRQMFTTYMYLPMLEQLLDRGITDSYSQVPNKRGGQNKREGQRSLLNLINTGGGQGRGVKINGVIRISKYSLISVMNKKECKQTRSEASKNKIIMKGLSNIPIN